MFTEQQQQRCKSNPQGPGNDNNEESGSNIACKYDTVLIYYPYAPFILLIYRKYDATLSIE